MMAQAGSIYADRSADGPEIGTLVAIVDRAKNLPNRKSMGKQDPYCTARLGKEAKKTETDKRGGQTPKWDQELRFTVRDSGDYDRLKISIFNDDKKTDLIGECWVPLDSVVVRGGGQNDTWHSLSCRGRYAGELRLELTYYDTRPRENVEDGRRSHAQNGSSRASHHASQGESITGPREPHTPKRRPLPSNLGISPSPTSSPPTQPASRPLPQPLDHESSHRHGLYADPQTEDAAHQSRGHRLSHVPRLGRQLPNPYEIASGQDTAASYQTAPRSQDPRAVHGVPSRASPQPDLDLEDGTSNSEQDMLSLQYDHDNDTRSSPRAFPRSPRQPASPISCSQSPRGSEVSPRYRATDPNMPLPLRPSSNATFRTSSERDGIPRHDLTHQSSSAGHVDQEALSPLAPRTEVHSQGLSHRDTRPFESNDRPPPTPVHRMSMSCTMPQLRGSREKHEEEGVIALASSPGSASLARRPLAHSQSEQLQSFGQSAMQQPVVNHRRPGSDSHPLMQQHRHSAHTPVSHYQRRSMSPSRSSPLATTPPSLVPGYEADRPINAMAHRNSAAPYNAQSVSDRGSFGTASSFDHTYPVPSPLGFKSASQRASISEAGATRSSRDALPRKSISPRPSMSPSIPSEHRSEVMFSPDSFDAFNPNMQRQNDMNLALSRDGSSNLSKVPSRTEEANKRHDGPIIGSNGRVIDPSDHLPTETWAPEPEQKNNKEIQASASRSSLRSDITANNPLMRNHLGRSPLAEAGMNGHGRPAVGLGSNTNSNDRSRLQKKPRGLPQGPSEDYIVPRPLQHAHTDPITPTRHSQPRNSPTAQVNHHSRDIYTQPVHPAHPVHPVHPVHPATHTTSSFSSSKENFSGQGEDWSHNSLSEEMSRIDIGSGSGHRARVKRFGF